jgi:inner membrane protein
MSDSDQPSPEAAAPSAELPAQAPPIDKPAEATAGGPPGAKEKKPGKRSLGGPIRIPKLFIIAALALAAVIPAYFIEALISERQARQAGVEDEFTRNWGPPQLLYGPILVLPYEPAPGRPRQYLEIAPAKLDIVTSLAPQERRRGLFHATVYDAKIDMEGTFSVPSQSRLEDFLADKNGRLIFEESFIVFGATSLTGIKAEDHIVIDGIETPWRPCEEVVRQKQDCAGAPLILAKTRTDGGAGGPFTIAFKSALSLRGTGSFMLGYAAKELGATIRSPWTSPSFTGEVLPESSTLGPDGFEAHWRTAEFGLPRISTSAAILDTALGKGRSFGVDLIEATPVYRMIDRVAKYGLLFVALAFATYLFFELLSELRIHVLQYGLVALSLSLFPLLLLSLGEMIGYTAGYVVSAALILAQASLYTASVAKRMVPAAIFAVMLASLFAFIYVLIGVETYSLLIGALALFAVLSALMVLTEKVQRPREQAPAPAQA